MVPLSDDESAASMRSRIRHTVESFPGIHLRGIVRQLDSSTALVRYHLDLLVTDKEVREVQVGGFMRYFPQKDYRELKPTERKVLQVLRQERPLEIILALLEHGPLQHRDLLEIVGGSKGTLSYHLDKLVQAGVVKKVPSGPEKGFHLVDPDKVRSLLVRYEPLPDVYDHVNDLWEDLFKGHRHTK